MSFKTYVVSLMYIFGCGYVVKGKFCLDYW